MRTDWFWGIRVNAVYDRLMKQDQDKFKEENSISKTNQNVHKCNNWFLFMFLQFFSRLIYKSLFVFKSIYTPVISLKPLHAILEGIEKSIFHPWLKGEENSSQESFCAFVQA